MTFVAFRRYGNMSVTVRRESLTDIRRVGGPPAVIHTVFVVVCLVAVKYFDPELIVIMPPP